MKLSHVQIRKARRRDADMIAKIRRLIESHSPTHPCSDLYLHHRIAIARYGERNVRRAGYGWAIELAQAAPSP